MCNRPRGVHDEDVVESLARLPERRLRDPDRAVFRIGREAVHADLARQDGELIDGRRAVDIAGGEKHGLLVLFFEAARELGNGRGLARAL